MILAQADGAIDSATTFLKALGESGLPTALIFLGFIFIGYLILDGRAKSKQDERDAQRSKMDAENLRSALDNRDNVVAKALADNTKATTAAAETALTIANRALISAEAQRVATSDNTAAIQHGDEPRKELTAATIAQTAEFGNLRTGIASQEGKMNTHQSEIMQQFDELKASMEKLLKAKESDPATQQAIMALLELNTKLLRKLIDLLNPPEATTPAMAAIVAMDTALKDAVNITPGPDVGIAS